MLRIFEGLNNEGQNFCFNERVYDDHSGLNSSSFALSLNALPTSWVHGLMTLIYHHACMQFEFG